MKFKCVDNSNTNLEIGKIYEGEILHEDTSHIVNIYTESNSCKSSRYHISKFEIVKEKTFDEVIATIKYEERWNNKFTSIIKNKDGIKIGRTDGQLIRCNYLLPEAGGLYTLQEARKEHTFLEALEALKAGKEVQSVIKGARYKKINGKYNYYDKHMGNWFIVSYFTTEEIDNAWYINN